MADLYGSIRFDNWNSSSHRFIFRRICHNYLWMRALFSYFHSSNNNSFGFRSNICKGHSVVLSIVGCAGVMLGFTNVADFGFIHYLVILPIIIGIVSLILFVKRQSKLEKPLINLSILKSKYFSAGTIFICILSACLNGCTALLPIFIQWSG